jgi:hypothetical protein
VVKARARLEAPGAEALEPKERQALDARIAARGVPGPAR